MGGAAAGGLLGADVLSDEGEAIAAGAILGGLLGGGVGDYLDRQDRRYMAQSTYAALESTPIGTARTWQNAGSGHHGRATPVDSFENANGRTCREFDVYIDGRAETARGTACREPRAWAPVTGRPDAPHAPYQRCARRAEMSSSLVIWERPSTSRSLASWYSSSKVRPS